MAEAPPLVNRRHDPVNLKLLVISADGQETGLAAIKTFLDQIGIPYDVLIATRTPLVPGQLYDRTQGFYQGIILCTGNLTYFKASTHDYDSAFSDSQWAILWDYEAMFGIRQVTLLTYPDGYPDNYGLKYVTEQDTTVQPLQATLTPAGQQVFADLNPNVVVTIQDAWTYLATIAAPADTTPLLVAPAGHALASLHRYPDGRQNLALTMDHNPDLIHSQLLSYGIINWVTKGLFLGERHVNMDIQVDDLLIENDIWDPAVLTDTTGLNFRMTGADLVAVVDWQNRVRSQYANARDMTIEWAFNGEGATGIYEPDTLTPEVKVNSHHFNWVNHTFSHMNLDDATYDQVLAELTDNHLIATQQLSLPHYYRNVMVQPDISGLYNPSFFKAAKDFGIQYIIADTSQPGWDNPSPNTGFYSSTQPSILIIPRRPTGLFWDLSTPAEWVSAYNCYFGPHASCVNGQWRQWSKDLNFEEILDTESGEWLEYLLQWDLDPLMFHQPNTRAYDGVNTLLGDLVEATLVKYHRVYNLPIRNLNEQQVGILMAQRMAYNQSGVSARLVPCVSLTLTTRNATLVPVTGLAYGGDYEIYGGQAISYIQLNAGQTYAVPAPRCTSPRLPRLLK